MNSQPGQPCRRVLRGTRQAAADYLPGPYSGPLLLIQSEAGAERELQTWRRFAPALQHYHLPGTEHTDLGDSRNEAVCAGVISRALQDLADRPPPGS